MERERVADRRDFAQKRFVADARAATDDARRWLAGESRGERRGSGRVANADLSERDRAGAPARRRAHGLDPNRHCELRLRTAHRGAPAHVVRARSHLRMVQRNERSRGDGAQIARDADVGEHDVETHALRDGVDRGPA